MTDMTESTDRRASGHDGGQPHADKYNDPRVSITRRGILIGIGVAIFGVIGSGFSIYARRTRLEKSTEFWGSETITALQLGERMELLRIGQSDAQPVELTTTPGLGHLRHLLLDERSYDWTTQQSRSATELCPQSIDPESTEPPRCIRLRLTDPTANRVGTVMLDFDLSTGWIGPGDGSRRVRATEWVRPKLQSYFSTVISVQQKRYDLRD